MYACATRSGGFAQLAPEAQRIIAGMFWVDEATASDWSRVYWREVPGNGQATILLYDRAGMDFSFLLMVSFFFRVPASALDPSFASPELPPDLQEALATIPRPPPVVAAEALKKPSPPFGPAPKGWRDWDFRDRRHPDGEMRWPLGVNSGPSKPYGLWPKEQRARYPGQELADVWQVSDYVREASRRFDALSDEDRAVFEARSELLRQEAWDEWEKDERDRELARERGERPRRRRYSNIKPRSSSDEISQLIRQVVAKPK